jgi:uncharacterized protein (TIGR00369 family)
MSDSDRAASDAAMDYEHRTASPLQKLLGYTLLQWGPDSAVLAYEVAEDHLNRTHQLHGGVVATLCDAAAGYAGVHRASAAEERRAIVTLSLTINFVGAVSRGRITAHARRRGGGKTVFFSDVEVRDQAGRIIATATGTFRYVAPRPSSGR